VTAAILELRQSRYENLPSTYPAAVFNDLAWDQLFQVIAVVTNAIIRSRNVAPNELGARHFNKVLLFGEQSILVTFVSYPGSGGVDAIDSGAKVFNELGDSQCPPIWLTFICTFFSAEVFHLQPAVALKGKRTSPPMICRLLDDWWLDQLNGDEAESAQC
jgi:hypothetical protein